MPCRYCTIFVNEVATTDSKSKGQIQSPSKVPTPLSYDSNITYLLVVRIDVDAHQQYEVSVSLAERQKENPIHSWMTLFASQAFGACLYGWPLPAALQLVIKTIYFNEIEIWCSQRLLPVSKYILVTQNFGNLSCQKRSFGYNYGSKKKKLLDNFLSKTLFFSMTMMLSRTLALNNKIFTLAVYLTSCLMASSPKFEFRLSLRTSIRKLEILSQLNDFVSMSTYSVVLCTYLFT